MTNKDIATLFRHLAASYTIKDEKKYRFQIIAYQKAADSLSSSPKEISESINDDTVAFPGIGTTIRMHLKELINTGHSAHFESILKDIPQSMFPLLEVPSIGPKTAYKLVTNLHLTNKETVIEELEKQAQEGRIEHLEGFGKKSQTDIITAIAEYRKGDRKIKRMALPFAYALADEMVTYLKKCKEAKEVSPLGSLRRMVSTIGDIDIAVATDHPEAVLTHFTSYPSIQRIIEQGPTSSSIILTNGRQIDLMTQPVKAFGSLLQHFTGSKNHNVHLREYALKKNLSLSEYGIKPKGEEKHKGIQTYATEEKFYNALGMDWIPPEIREDSGEIEHAITHTLPKLVTVSDMKGDLHIHSSFSIEPSHDMGQSSMEEMLSVAKELGYEYLAFSEHNPSVSKHTKDEVYAIMTKKRNKIEQLNLSNKYIRAINMIECDILANGDLALDDKSLETLDGAIVSIHSSFGMDKKTMTKRILQGLSHPKARIFSHPTGRLINERNGYQVDFDELFAFCAQHNKAIEINSWPERLDLPDTLVKQAIEQNVKLVINTDSHHKDHMQLMRFGVSVARRGWAQKHDILNTLPYNTFIAWLHDTTT